MKANRVTIVLETGDGEEREIRALLDAATDGTGWEVSGYAAGDHLMARSTLKRATEALEQARSLVGACVEPGQEVRAPEREPFCRAITPAELRAKVDTMHEPEGLAWPGPWERNSNAEWGRKWNPDRWAVFGEDGSVWHRDAYPVRHIGRLGPIVRLGPMRTAAHLRVARALLAAICDGDDPHPIPAELLGEEQA